MRTPTQRVQTVVRIGLLSGMCGVLIAAASATPRQYGCDVPADPPYAVGGIDASTIDTVPLLSLGAYAKGLGISQNNYFAEFTSTNNGKVLARPHYGMCYLKPSDFNGGAGRLIARVVHSDASNTLGFLGLSADKEALIWLDRAGGSNRDQWRIIAIGTSTATRRAMTAAPKTDSTQWPCSGKRYPVCLATDGNAFTQLAIAAVADGFLQATLP